MTYYGYDAASRTSLLQHRKSSGTLIERYDYTRDEVGNITKILRGSDSLNTYFNYDKASRITKEAWRTSGGVNDHIYAYSYDAAGNRLSKENQIAASTVYWEYDQADQMTYQKSGAPTTVEFTFDNNGNLSVENDLDASAGRTYYDYEPRNLLTRVDFPGATATNYFYYNAAGERTRKDDSTGGKKYTWDGIDVITEKNLSGSTTQRLVKGYTPIGGIGAYAMQDVNGTIIYPHKNQVGTTMRHTDTSGNVTNTYEYDAWGVPLLVTQGTAQQYRFTQKELDPDSIAFNVNNSRYHFLFRFYVSFSGVFGQSDPQLFAAVKRPLYPYAYGVNAPTIYVDPRGLQQREFDRKKATRDETLLHGDPEEADRRRAQEAADAPWNDPRRVAGNNCYEYACGDLGPVDQPNDKHFRHPGQLGIGVHARKDCIAYIEAAIRDGMQQIKRDENKAPILEDGLPCCPPGYRLVYLTVLLPADDPDTSRPLAERGDYHWYRYDGSNLGWSHKRGGNKVSRVDRSGKKITLPHEANHGVKWQKCGYLCAPIPK